MGGTEPAGVKSLIGWILGRDFRYSADPTWQSARKFSVFVSGFEVVRLSPSDRVFAVRPNDVRHRDFLLVFSDDCNARNESSPIAPFESSKVAAD